MVQNDSNEKFKHYIASYYPFKDLFHPKEPSEFNEQTGLLSPVKQQKKIMENQLITVEEAYKAMFLYLENLYNMEYEIIILFSVFR
jgi:hypothetical protein